MKQTLKLTVFALIIFTFAVVPLSAKTNEKAKNRVEELLAKAREAIGGDAKIKAVKSLSLAGKFQRGVSTNEVEFDFLFPDKYLKREKINTPLGTAATVYAIDGETAWFNASSSNETIKFENVSQKDTDVRKPIFRADAARWVLGLLLRTPNGSPLEFAYAGEGAADGKPTFLIDVKGTDGFQARLFLDKTTLRLAMVSYTGKLTVNKRVEIKTDENGNVSESESGSAAGTKADEVRVRYSD